MYYIVIIIIIPVVIVLLLAALVHIFEYILNMHNDIIDNSNYYTSLNNVKCIM
jgi:hypothetical protein